MKYNNKKGYECCHFDCNGLCDYIVDIDFVCSVFDVNGEKIGKKRESHK